MIAVIDCKTSNIGSVVNMFRRIGKPVFVAQTPAELDRATQILLPGVGHFDTCARNLRRLGFVDALEEHVLHKGCPILGVCVGAQLLTRGSEEGDESGLGWIPAYASRFKPDRSRGVKVPHMGWNTVEVVRDQRLFSGFPSTPRFYFVHSYFIKCDSGSEQHVLGRTRHGIDFDSAIGAARIAGVQFHPEKSHLFGMQLLRNFASFTGDEPPC